MAKKSKKVVEIVETPEKEEILEVEEIPVEVEELSEETPEEIPEETPKKNDIKEVLNHKKKISEKQREHLQKSREIMIQREKTKKEYTKKMEKLIKLGYDIDELLERAEQENIIKQYNELNKNKIVNQSEQPKKVKKVKYESEEDEEPIRQEKKTLSKQELLRQKLRGLF